MGELEAIRERHTYPPPGMHQGTSVCRCGADWHECDARLLLAEVERLRGVVEAQAKVIRAEDVSWELARRYDEGDHAALEHAAFKAREKARAALAALEAGDG